MKTCTKCNLEKEFSQFQKRTLSKDGLDYWCKSCKSLYNKNKHFEPQYEGTKVCSCCSLEKLRVDFHKDHRMSDGLEGRCKACGNIRSHSNDVKRKYNITVEQYQELLKQQQYSCAICFTTGPGGPADRFSVDHDHKTGRVRGLLCNSCNNGLGRFKDNVEFLRNAASYLEDNVP